MKLDGGRRAEGREGGEESGESVEGRGGGACARSRLVAWSREKRDA